MSDSLPQRMREAAKVLSEATERSGSGVVYWDPTGLRACAARLEAEDNAAAEREAKEWELAAEFIEALPAGTGLHLGIFYNAARKLIGAGWTKADSK